MIEAIRIRAVLNKSKIRIRSRCRDLVSNIEFYLHDCIRHTLKEIYSERSWWVDGIPVGIRINISKAFEEKLCIGDRYNYTNLFHLKGIWKKNFTLFSDIGPFSMWGRDKTKMMNDFDKLNFIRNKLMHSPHQYNPTDEDLNFLEYFTKNLFSQ